MSYGATWADTMLLCGARSLYSSTLQVSSPFGSGDYPEVGKTTWVRSAGRMRTTDPSLRSGWQNPSLSSWAQRRIYRGL